MPETSFAAKHFCGDRTKLRGGGIGATGEAAPAAGVVAVARRFAARGFARSRPRPETSRAMRIVAGRPRCLAREVCQSVWRFLSAPRGAHRARGTAHQKGRRGRAAAVGEDERGREVCPRCGLSFADVAALVAHVEREHEGGAEALAKVLVAV